MGPGLHVGTSEKPIDRERLRAAVLDLAPWYFDIEVRDGLSTSLYLDAPSRPGTTEVPIRILDSMDGTSPGFMDFARKRFRVVRCGPTCRIFELAERERPPFRPQGD